MIRCLPWFLLALFLVTSCVEEETPVSTFSLTSPVDGSKEVSVRPTLRWTEAKGAERYVLSISLDESLTDILHQYTIDGTTFELPEALKEGYRYYWKVEGVNAAGATPAENNGISFRTVILPPTPSPGVSKYHVDALGIDNPGRGSFYLPFKTVAFAAQQVPPGEGDTIFVHSGTYEERDPILLPVGVSLIGAGQDATILTSSGVSLPKDVNPSSADYKLQHHGALLQLVSRDRMIPGNINSSMLPPEKGSQVIAGFTIDGQQKKLKAGIWVQNRNDVSIHDISFRDVDQRGLVVAAGNKPWFRYPEYFLTGIEIYNCHFSNCARDLSDESLGALNLAQLDGAKIHNITIRENEGYGIKFIYDGYFKNTSIYNCGILVNESDAKWGEDIAIELWNLGEGNVVEGITCNTWISVVNHPDVFDNPNAGRNLLIQNVKIIDRDGMSNKEGIELGLTALEVTDTYIENKGIGIAIWEMGRARLNIHHNIFYNSKEMTNWASGAAIYIDNSKTWYFDDILIANNVFDRHHVAVKMKGAKIRNVQIVNNIFSNAGKAEIEAEGENIVLLNNAKHNNIRPTWNTTGLSSQSGNLSVDPLFNSVGSRSENFYKPRNTSPVIDAGVNVGLPFTGSAPDIGKFDQ